MRILKSSIMVLSTLLLLQGLVQTSSAAPQEKIEPGVRCPVCGMFVVKYPNWITQIHHSNGTVKLFDGVKDMMVYYYNTQKHGQDSQETIQEIWVKDYYKLRWIDGRKAFYVIGSDVYGPMGRELIPFDSKKAAESFLKDHHGKKIVTFEEITSALVDSMLSGM